AKASNKRKWYIKCWCTKVNSNCMVLVGTSAYGYYRKYVTCFTGVGHGKSSLPINKMGGTSDGEG
ncbi:unnamed protein product, partial [marine sediment metagenome]